MRKSRKRKIRIPHTPTPQTELTTADILEYFFLPLSLHVFAYFNIIATILYILSMFTF